MMGSECSILLNRAYSLLNDLSVFIFFAKMADAEANLQARVATGYAPTVQIAALRD